MSSAALPAGAIGGVPMAVGLLKTKCAAAMEADCALHLMN
jgi:hypothetical protein